MVILVQGPNKVPISSEMLLVALWHVLTDEQRDRAVANLGQITAKQPHLMISNDKVVLPPGNGAS